MCVTILTAGKNNILVKSLSLTTDDRDDILKGRKLNDRVINAAQTMMKRQFPDQKGLQDTVVLEGAQAWDDVPQRFTQIVFDRSRKHWVCVSNKFTDGIVEVYDSLPTKTFAVSKSVMRQVATILKTQENSFKLRSVKNTI